MTALRIYNSNHGALLRKSTTPSMDIIEREKEYMLSINLPGVPKEKINISVKERILTLEVKEEESPAEEGRYLVRNRRNRAFKQNLQLPEDSNGDSLKASLDNGVLYITLDKKTEATPRQISIA